MNHAATSGLLSPSDIADLAGVTRAAVSNWRTRHQDFPPAREGSDANPLFDREEVVQWLKASGRTIKTTSPGAQIWPVINALRGAHSPSEATTLVLLLATIKKASAETGEKANPYQKLLDAPATERESVVDEVTRWIVAQPGLSFVEPLEVNFDWSSDEVWAVVTMIGQLETNALAEMVDYCLERGQQWQGRAGGDYGEFNSPVSQLLVELAAPHGPQIYDPACGLGTVLVSLGERKPNLELIGHDISGAALSVMAQRAYLRNVKISLAEADVLLADPDSALRANAVVAQPPLVARWDAPAALTDPRFRFGVPPRNNADMAWIQHAMAHLAPEGTAYVVTSLATAFRGGIDATIRRELVNAGCVEAVVALPSRLQQGSSLPLVLWKLRPAESPDSGTDVLFINANELKQRDLVDVVVSALQRISPSASQGPEAPLARVPIAEILAEEANLTPNRWIQRALIDPAEIRERYSRGLVEAERQLSTPFPDLVPQLRALELAESTVVTIAELRDRGVLETRVGRVRIPYGSDDVPANLVRARDVRSGALPVLDNTTSVIGTEAEHLTKPNDVIVARVGDPMALVDPSGGFLPDQTVDVITINRPDLLNAEFLAAVISGLWNAADLSTGSHAMARVRVGSLEVPLVALDVQERLADAIRTIRQTRRQAEILAELTTTIEANLLEMLRYEA